MLVIGLMSGTSLDGVDASLVKITKSNNTYKYEQVGFLFVPYEEDVKNKIMEASKLNSSNVQKICSLNFELGYIYKDVVIRLLDKYNLNKDDIEFIAMHGQTIWHNPDNLDGYFSSTLQIGEPSIIAYHLDTLVISNFRTMDMAAGGSGAPLVPFVNYALFKSDTKNIAFQNIGGIGNVAYIPKNACAKDVIAFDTGPGNMLIDEAMKLLFGKPYDESGRVALSGKVNEEVLAYLMKDEYLDLPYPKSTGREKYSKQYLEEILNMMKDEPHENIIATLSAYTADTISYAYKKFLKDVDELILSGGGSHNKFIVNRLKEKLNIPVLIHKESDSYEAYCFAILGHYTYMKKPSNMISVTGAKDEVILGNYTYPPRKRDD